MTPGRLSLLPGPFLLILCLLGPELSGRSERLIEVQQDANPRLLWRLPGYCYVKYRGSRGRSRTSAIGTRLTSGFYSHEVKKNKHVLFSRYDLADLLPMVALSLSGHAPKPGATSRLSFDTSDCIGAGSLSVKGRIKTVSVANPERVREEGSFRITGTEKPKPAVGTRDGGRAAPRRVGPRGAAQKKYIQKATIQFERIVDALSGRVVAFEGKISGSYVTHRGAEPRKFNHEESWRFEAIHRPDTADFRKRVNEAIDRGQDWLAQHSRGTMGQKALALLTLCKNNADRDSEAIQELLEDLRASQPRQTYDLAVSIQALESYYESPNESKRLRQGDISKPSPRRLALDDLDLMVQWLKRLLANKSTSGGNRWRYHYVSDAGFDNSNTQFAALGLQAAERCDLKVPQEAWTGLAWHFLRERLDGKNGKARIKLTSYRDLARRKKASEKAGKKATQTSSRGPEVKVRGFNYHKADRTSAGGRRLRAAPQRNQVAYGSMTCAGVTGLTIAGAALGGRKKRSSKLLAKVSTARMEGFAWLHRNYEVRRNPGRGQTWYYYYLYSLERTCELGGIARIQNKNWYFDGAMQILDLQNADGSFETPAEQRILVDTCFAILFLKRAIAPVITK